MILISASGFKLLILMFSVEAFEYTIRYGYLVKHNFVILTRCNSRP